jgi:hypothetical protein
MVSPGWAAAMAWSLAGSFFKSRHCVVGLLGMLGTPAKLGLPQLVEQIAHARDTAVFNPVFAPNQALHVRRTPSTYAVFADLRGHAGACLERCPLGLS